MRLPVCSNSYEIDSVNEIEIIIFKDLIRNLAIWSKPLSDILLAKINNQLKK
jgi:hypothetical protein